MKLERKIRNCAVRDLGQLLANLHAKIFILTQQVTDKTLQTAILFFERAKPLGQADKIIVGECETTARIVHGYGAGINIESTNVHEFLPAELRLQEVDVQPCPDSAGLCSSG